MPYTADRPAYLRSLSNELAAQASRVRDLIGDRHWLSDGHHKEHLLRGLLRRHLPSATIASRGFVLDQGRSGQCSTEQDVLVLDCSSQAPLFDQSDLVVAFASTVLASVSVKTRYGTKELGDATKGLLGQRAFLRDVEPVPVWRGAYFFEMDVTSAADRLAAQTKKAIRAVLGGEAKLYPLGAEYCLRVGAEAIVRVVFREDHAVIDAFSPCQDATGVFLARILAHVSDVRGSGASDFPDFVDDVTGALVDAARSSVTLNRNSL